LQHRRIRKNIASGNLKGWQLEKLSAFFTDGTVLGVIAYERPLAGWVGLTADFNARVAAVRQAVTQFKFEVGKVLVLPDEIRQSVGTSVSNNRSIANSPVRHTLYRRCVPALDRLAVENGDEAVAVGLFLAF